MTRSRRVVVVGMGAVTPAGNDVTSLTTALMDGASFASPLPFEIARCPAKVACRAERFDPGEYLRPTEVRRTDRAAQLAIAAALQAVEQAGSPEVAADRRAVVVGTGGGGFWTWAKLQERWHDEGYRAVGPFSLPMVMSNASAALLSVMLQAEGPSLTVNGACAAGSQAIAEATRYVRDGYADVAIAGGTDAVITPTTIAGFARMGALSRRDDDVRRSSRPFDVARDGFVLGEGAGMLVLEEMAHAERRGATILAEVAGIGMSSDAHDIAAPRPDGKSAARCMRRALDDAGIDHASVTHVNAHATSTPSGDHCEALALRMVFGDRPPPVTAVKGSIGHLIGGAGAVELIAAVDAMRCRRVQPVANCDMPDPELGIDVVAKVSRPIEMGAVLKNSFAFGGHNVSLVLTPAEGH